MVQAAVVAGESRRAPENHHLRRREDACELGIRRHRVPFQAFCMIIHAQDTKCSLGKYSLGSDSYTQKPEGDLKPGFRAA